LAISAAPVAISSAADIITRVLAIAFLQAKLDAFERHLWCFSFTGVREKHRAQFLFEP
jgi:hypothetical protein